MEQFKPLNNCVENRNKGAYVLVEYYDITILVCCNLASCIATVSRPSKHTTWFHVRFRWKSGGEVTW